MKIRNLSQQEMTAVYHEHMTHDFPAAELKPLPVILDAIERGRYVALGAWEDDTLLAYLLLVQQVRDYFVDFFAVVRGKRNAGLGSQCLGEIIASLHHPDSLILEVEEPEAAADAAEKMLRLRRIGFYQRNGFVDTGVRVCAFGVPFRILELVGGSSHSEQALFSLYRSHYEQVLPKEVCARQIVLSDRN